MFARAAAAAGLGPAQGLPPTLQPMAVLSAAPPAPRAASLLGASVLYALCAAAVLFAPRVAPVALPPLTHGGGEVMPEDPGPVVNVVLPKPPVPPLDRVIRVKGAPERPSDWKPPAETVNVPLEPPSTFPSVDLTGTNLAALKPGERPAPVGSGAGSNLGWGTASGDGGTSSGHVMSIEVTQLQVLRQVAPTYPALARATRRQGSVVLLMTIDTQGVPVEVKLLSTPDPSLAAEAERAARLWRFAPALLNGQPVNAQFRLTLNFRLQ